MREVNNFEKENLKVKTNLLEEKQEGSKSVSYTHLDVYKRQANSSFSIGYKTDQLPSDRERKSFANFGVILTDILTAPVLAQFLLASTVFCIPDSLHQNR